MLLLFVCCIVVCLAYCFAWGGWGAGRAWDTGPLVASITTPRRVLPLSMASCTWSQYYYYYYYYYY